MEKFDRIICILNLGDWEIKDYAFVVEEIKKKYAFIDSAYVGIRGFSYGGYATVMALLKAPETFKAGIAGGAVTTGVFMMNIYGAIYGYPLP